MRKDYKEIQEIAKKMNCTDIYSWSKYNTYIGDKYIYFLKYILKIPEDRNDSIYAPMGTASHDSLESFYLDKFTQEQMSEYFEEKLFEFTVGGLKYDRSDDEKNKKIGDKYEACLRHFFINHHRIKGKPLLEIFIPIKIKNILFQGYIDFIHKEVRENKDFYIVTDFKTSSIYKGEKYEKEKGQLILYGLGIHQKLNIPLNQIIIRWAFLKYVEVECLQANGKWKSRIIERNDIGGSLESSAKMWLKKSSIKPSEDDIEKYLERIKQENALDCLPNDVKDKFEIKDCYVEVSLTDESIKELTDNIVSTVKEIKEKEEEYGKTKNSRLWWQEVTDKESYFMSNLSGYSSKIHLPYKEYLENRDLFRNKEENKTEDDNDLSWLNGLLN
jgi:hypothetical protein